MNWDLRQYGLAVGCTAAIATVIALPAQAAQTEITGVQLTPVGQGFELMLKTQGNNRPPVFTVNRGNASVADISNAQLRLTTGATFTQANPAPGITSVEVRQLNSSTVRITVTGTNAAPISNTVRGDESQGILALRFNAADGLETGAATSAQPPSGAFPNATPPLQRRPVAPPVGDMAVGTINAEPDIIDLGSGQIIPKLLLRNAPVREVLTLLGRAAGVNVAFAEGDSAGATGDDASSESTISLDIENESVQDVFNYVLRLSGLDANKVGNTIFVGKELPGDAKNRIIRSIRLNQLRATAKTSFTNAIVNTSQVGGSTSGAQASITADGDSASSSITGSNTSASLSTLGRLSRLVESFSEKGAKEVLESYGANNGGTGEEVAASTLLKGLEVVADARINSVTLIGTPRKVEIATSLLKQLDIRKRQVAVNVKMIDINLGKNKEFGSDLQFRANDSLGVGFRPINGLDNPASGLGFVFGAGGASPFTGGITTVANAVLGNLFASIRNDDAKILTNPTLIIQEGSSAQVNLTEEIFSGLESTTNESASPSGGVTQAVSVKPIIRQAGVIFNVTVDRVDDNGFVTLNVSPEVSAPISTFNFVFPGVEEGTTGTLLSQRRLETGKIRLRDGQTLILSGIIQDTDRTTVSKVPILGDIPILGRLFRRESGEKSRRELVVIVTPQVMDDSDQATTGYQYAPSPDAQSLLNR